MPFIDLRTCSETVSTGRRFGRASKKLSCIQPLKISKIHLPGFTKKVKVPFSHLYHLVWGRHLFLHFENNGQVEVNTTCNLVSVVLAEDNSNDLRLCKKSMITGLS